MARNVGKNVAKKIVKKSEAMPSAPATKAVRKSEAQLRAFALGFPEATEDFPWGERAIKVKQKVFLFMRTSNEGLSLGMKLARSNTLALSLPFCEPTHYGLGKSGWITAKFAPKEKPPLPLLEEWIGESYRAVAPKRLVGELDAHANKKRPSKKKKR